MNKTKKLINQYKTTFFSFFILIPFDFRHVGFRSGGSLLVNPSVCPIHRLLRFCFLSRFDHFARSALGLVWSFLPARPDVILVSRRRLVDSGSKTSKIMSSIRWNNGSSGKEAHSHSEIRIGGGQWDNEGRSQTEWIAVVVVVAGCCNANADGQVKWMLLFSVGDGSEYGANTYPTQPVLRFYEMQNWINSNAAQPELYVRSSWTGR